MVESMKKVAKLGCEMTVEERNLLSVGYKNVIGARRASWRIMSSIEQKEESKGNEHNVKLIKGYRHKVEEELSKICGDILTIIDKHLIPSSTSGEATVFYYKMWVICTNIMLDFFMLPLSYMKLGVCSCRWLTFYHFPFTDSNIVICYNLSAIVGYVCMYRQTNTHIICKRFIQ